jgi:hypothetical protein
MGRGGRGGVKDRIPLSFGDLRGLSLRWRRRREWAGAHGPTGDAYGVTNVRAPALPLTNSEIW